MGQDQSTHLQYLKYMWEYHKITLLMTIHLNKQKMAEINHSYICFALYSIFED
jgi:hypothetical protein